MFRYLIRADEYRARAAEAALASAATPLAQVREKHDLAVQRWTILAEAEEARAGQRAARDAGAVAEDETDADEQYARG